MSLPGSVAGRNRLHDPVACLLIAAIHIAPAFALTMIVSAKALQSQKPIQQQPPMIKTTENSDHSGAKILTAIAIAPPARDLKTGAILSSDDLPTASTPRSAFSRNGGPTKFRTVQVTDDLNLIGDGVAIRLAGVEQLASDAMCRRLDGESLPCVRRAVDRLEILTRGRQVTCQLQGALTNEPRRARCWADKIDLADDLVKSGLARRA